MEIIPLILITWFNMKLAKQKNHNQLLWAFLTVIGYFLIGFFLTTIYILLIYKGPMEQEAMQAFVFNLKNEPLKLMLITLFMVGGGLLMRFILERIPANPSRDNLQN